MSSTMVDLSCEGIPARGAGASSSENAGMSNERVVKTHPAGRLRFPPLWQSSEGKPALRRGRKA